MLKLYKLGAVVLSVMLMAASCEEPVDVKPAPEYSTMSDVQGNVYKTVKIGGKWWMAENLRTTVKRDSSEIANLSNIQEWSQATSPALCDYDNIKENAATYGHLYNWYALTDSLSIAPEGWHVPSDAEWKELERELGMDEGSANAMGWRGAEEGNKLKVQAPAGWTRLTGDPVWGNNESGFSALAGSCRLPDGKFGNPGLFATGFWWSNTPQGLDKAYYRYLDKSNTNIYRNTTDKNYGFSVRLVKD